MKPTDEKGTPMNLCCLTLIFPRALEETLVDFMLNNPYAQQGFTSSMIDGHGHDAALVSMNEKVRGRAKKVRTDIILAEDKAEELLAQMQKDFPHIRLVYWLSPVSRFGRFS